ncbi:SurA N-terminal domain-containing protein [Kordiimonas pumila]|uniref:Parvulin-like PPIase n=1 Tax=Kordiimonas pumila TaxID=2161677 RepID=A0ABV7D270_9PROT|nr:peptidyl-prolyl cis-trans isomerase [Kordiimonas pumila]
MLLKLRGGLDSFFVTVLLGLLIGAFAIWGIGPNMLSSSGQNIATVGDTEVSTNRYYAQVQSRAQQIQLQTGGQLSTPEIIKMLRLDEQVLQQMIVVAAVTEHMSSLGLRAGNDLIKKELASYEGFMLPDGTISKEMIEQALQSNNISRKEFMDDIRRSIGLEHLLGSFTTDSALSRDYAEALYTWQNERRRASMINIQASNIAIENPSEETLTTFFEDNKNAYKAPERRSYSYLMVTPAMFEAEVTVPEEDIVAVYESRADTYNVPETRDLLQASFKDKDAAEAFIAAVNAGSDFSEAAASVTEFTEDEIKLGNFSKKAIQQETDEDIATAIFSTPAGDMTEPLKAFSGWNVYKVDSVTAATHTSLESVRSDITAELKAEEAINQMYDFLPRMEDALANDPSLSAVAKELSLNLATVSAVDARGKTTAGTVAVTSQEEARVLADAFQKEKGVEPELTDLDPSDSEKGVYLLEVTDIAPSYEQSLDDVRVSVVSAWKAQQKQAKAGEIAEDARTQLAAGGNPEEISETLGGTSFDAKNIARTGDENSNLSPTIRSLIFDLPLGETGSEKAADGNGYIVVRVNDITPGNPASNKADVDALLASLNGGFKDELLAQYQSYLLEKYKPVVNRQQQQQLFSSETAQ